MAKEDEENEEEEAEASSKHEQDQAMSSEVIEITVMRLPVPSVLGECAAMPERSPCQCGTRACQG